MYEECKKLQERTLSISSDSRNAQNAALLSRIGLLESEIRSALGISPDDPSVRTAVHAARALEARGRSADLERSSFRRALKAYAGLCFLPPDSPDRNDRLRDALSLHLGVEKQLDLLDHAAGRASSLVGGTDVHPGYVRVLNAAFAGTRYLNAARGRSIHRTGLQEILRRIAADTLTPPSKPDELVALVTDLIGPALARLQLRTIEEEDAEVIEIGFGPEPVPWEGAHSFPSAEAAAFMRTRYLSERDELLSYAEAGRRQGPSLTATEAEVLESEALAIMREDPNLIRMTLPVATDYDTLLCQAVMRERTILQGTAPEGLTVAASALLTPIEFPHDDDGGNGLIGLGLSDEICRTLFDAGIPWLGSVLARTQQELESTGLAGAETIKVIKAVRAVSQLYEIRLSLGMDLGAHPTAVRAWLAQ